MATKNESQSALGAAFIHTVSTITNAIVKGAARSRRRRTSV
jgi:hypothetical protein